MDISLGKVKPKFFATVGWSWAAMGILGLLAGLIGIIGIPGILKLKRMLLNAEEGFSPEMAEAFYPIFKWWIPAIITKFVLSGILTYVSIMFLKGIRWAYYTLMGVNYFVLVSIVGGYFFSLAAYQKMIQKVLASGALEGTGFDLSLPSMFSPLMLTLLLLFLLPFIFFAWYFHWQPVKEYFAGNPS